MSEHTHRIAVVVFCEVDCEGAEDAEVVAQQAIRRKVITDDLTFEGYGRTWPIRAVRVMEAGVAAGNGYLWTQPTPKAYREGGSR